MFIPEPKMNHNCTKLTSGDVTQNLVYIKEAILIKLDSECLEAINQVLGWNIVHIFFGK
jgi:hypothetical protein